MFSVRKKSPPICPLPFRSDLRKLEKKLNWIIMYRDVYMLSLHSLYKYMKQIKSVTVQKMTYENHTMQLTMMNMNRN